MGEISGACLCCIIIMCSPIAVYLSANNKCSGQVLLNCCLYIFCFPGAICHAVWFCHFHQKPPVMEAPVAPAPAYAVAPAPAPAVAPAVAPAPAPAPAPAVAPAVAPVSPV